MDAIDFHSEIAASFDAKYSSSKDFIERYNVWTHFLDKYLFASAFVLDVGCGSGVLSFYSARISCQVIGFDGSKDMIELCKTKQNNFNYDNIEFSVNSIPHGLSQMKDFDIIISSSVLEYIKDFDITIEALFNSISNNGVLLLSLPNKQSIYRKVEYLFYAVFRRPKYLQHVHNVLTEKDAIKKFKAIGFEFIELEYFACNYKFSSIIRFFAGKRYSSNLIIYVLKKSEG